MAHIQNRFTKYEYGNIYRLQQWNSAVTFIKLSSTGHWNPQTLLLTYSLSTTTTTTITTTTLSVAQQPNSGQSSLIFEVPRSQIIRHTTQYDSSERVISPSQSRHPTQHTKNTKTNIHATSGIQTSDPWNIAATDLRLRPHGTRECYYYYYNHVIHHLNIHLNKCQRYR